MDSSSTNLSTQTSYKEVVELNTSSLVKEDTQQTSVPIISSNLIQSGSIGEQKEICSTQELENKLKNIEDLKITVDIHQIKQPDIKDEKHAKQLLTTSKILTVSSVPIQVAESVLQMEPKKSMSNSQIIPQEILPSTITSGHLTGIEDKVHINGSTSSNDFVQDKEKLNLDNNTTMKNIDTANKLNESLIKLEETSQILLSIEKIQPQLAEISVLSSGNLETPEKPVQAEIIELEQKSTENEYCIKETTESAEILTEYETIKPLSSDKTPVRPSRTKELNAPLTSVPKTTQSDSSGQEKVAKKPIQKSIEKSILEEKPMETTDADSTEKKVPKKIMKKVTRKTKTKSEEGLEDGATDSSSSSKQKKSVKVVKKGIKPLQTPVTDAAVSETPSSSTSDAPIPPKRKTKTTTAKLIKKSDIEQ